MKKDYRSPDPQYIIADDYAGWPQTLPAEPGTCTEAMTAVMEQFIAEDTTAAVLRRLDEEEICACREDYTTLMEQDKIECEARLAELAEEEASIKERIKRERDTLASIMQRINDNVRTINKGIVDEELPRDRSVRIAVDGHYLYYTYAEAQSCFRLAKVWPIPESDNTMFSRQTKNQEVFIGLFGVEFTPRKSFEVATVAHLREELDKASHPVARLAVTVFNPDGLELAARDQLIDEEVLGTLIEADVAAVVIYTSRDAEVDA